MSADKAPSKVAGIKQTRTALKAHKAKLVYVAKDANPDAVQEVLDLCKQQGIEVVSDMTMRELGKACKIDVGCAVSADLI